MGEELINEELPTEIEWDVTEDEYGIYKKRLNEHGVLEELITRKQKWIDENPPQEPPKPLPSPLELKVKEQEMFIADLQQRNATLQDDNLFLFEETQRLNERDSRFQDDLLFVFEIIGG